MISPNLRKSSLIIVVLAMACAKTKAGTSLDVGGDGSARGRALEVGARVIVENATAAFVEATVVAVVRDRARVQLATTGEVTDQSLSEVYVPSSEDVVPNAPATAESAPHDDARPLMAEPTLREGSYAVCHMPDNRWRGCRIEATTTRASVVDDEATAADLPWHELLVPTPVTELNVRQRFDRNAKRRAFRDGARSAGRPRVPSNWRPGLNERVIAERDGGWVGAQIKGVKRGTARLEWESDRRVSDTNLAEVCPEPPMDFAPTVGTYVLARPTRGARVWAVLRIESTGSAMLVLSDELGDQQERSLRDLIPLERSGR
jgi:hypothetical protein